MKIGYARTSTVEQSAGFVDQKRELRRAGVERLYSEQVSAVAQSRPQFDLIIASLRKGDVVIVTKWTASPVPWPTLSRSLRRSRWRGPQRRNLTRNP